MLPKIVVFPPPAVLRSHDTECAPCEQMKNIPMGAMPPENARRKQFYSTSGATFQWNLMLRRKPQPESGENGHGGEESRQSGTRLIL